jgi:hypothetical protein
MSINVNLVYTSVQQILLKEIGSGYLSPDQFNSFANQATIEIFNRNAEIFQDTSRITEKLTPFIKRSVIQVDDTGKMNYPSDWVHTLAVRAYDPDGLDEAVEECDDDNPPDYNTIKQIKVKVIDNDKLGDRLTSTIVAPTRYRPIVTMYSTYAQWYPIDVGAGVLDYLRKPLETVWAYTINGDDLEVYDPANSVDFEWNWQMRNELIITICKYFGVSVREDQIYQYSNQLQSQQA